MNFVALFKSPQKMKSFVVLMILLLSLSGMIQHGNSRKLVQYNLDDKQVWVAKKSLKNKEKEVELLLQVLPRGSPQVPSRSNPPGYIPSYPSSRKLVQYNLDDKQVWVAKKSLKNEEKEVELLLQVLPRGSPQVPSRSNPPGYIPSYPSSRKLVQYNLDDKQVWVAKKSLKNEEKEVELLLQVLPRGSPQVPSGSNPSGYIPSYPSSRKLVQYNLDDKQVWVAKKSLKNKEKEVELLLQVLPRGSPQIPSGSNPPGYIPSDPNRT